MFEDDEFTFEKIGIDGTVDILRNAHDVFEEVSIFHVLVGITRRACVANDVPLTEDFLRGMAVGCGLLSSWERGISRSIRLMYETKGVSSNTVLQMCAAAVVRMYDEQQATDEDLGTVEALEEINRLLADASGNEDVD